MSHQYLPRRAPQNHQNQATSQFKGMVSRNHLRSQLPSYTTPKQCEKPLGIMHEQSCEYQTLHLLTISSWRQLLQNYQQWKAKIKVYVYFDRHTKPWNLNVGDLTLVKERPHFEPCTIQHVKCSMITARQASDQKEVTLQQLSLQDVRGISRKDHCTN